MAVIADSRCVGLVTTWLNSDYWLRIIAGAAEVLGKEGFAPVCFSLGSHPQGEPRKPCAFYDLVNRSYLSGVMLVSAASFQSDAEEFLRRFQGLPAVCVGRRLEAVPSLWVQNALGIRMLMRHLTEVCGRRRIAFIRGTENNLEAEARFRAWEDYTFERSLPRDELVEQGEFTEDTGEAATARLLDRNANQLPDALVASNDRMAIGALNALRKRGLRVPDDISVVGFDDLEAERANPPLTTIRQPVFEMGYRAAETLVAQIRKNSITHAQMFSPELVVRASCRPNQSSSNCKPECCGLGARTFLDSAFPSPERLTPALLELLHSTPETPAPNTAQLEQLACDLDRSARANKVREESLMTSVRDLRAYVVGRLEHALSQANSMRELYGIIQAHLQTLGLDSLVLAAVRDDSGFQGEARLVLDCRVTTKPAVAAVQSWVPSSQIVAAQAERGNGALRIVQPLYTEQGDAWGFFVTSGTLLDSSALNRIGVALARTAQRVGK